MKYRLHESKPGSGWGRRPTRLTPLSVGPLFLGVVAIWIGVAWVSSSPAQDWSVRSSAEPEAGDWIRRYHALQHAGMAEAQAQEEVRFAYERVERARGEETWSSRPENVLDPMTIEDGLAEAPFKSPRLVEQIPR